MSFLCSKIFQGEVVMSEELDAMTDSLYTNTVPKMWEAVAYPSLQNLASWVDDLVERMKFISYVFEFENQPFYSTEELEHYCEQRVTCLEVVATEFFSLYNM